MNALVSLGPTFVKLGQVFGSRPDVVPEPYLSVLGRLTDRVPGVPFEEIEHEIVTAYGRMPEEIFESFDRNALASGSLGQVYRARYQGRDVVVKVLRPGVAAGSAALRVQARQIAVNQSLPQEAGAPAPAGLLRQRSAG